MYPWSGAYVKAYYSVAIKAGMHRSYQILTTLLGNSSFFATRYHDSHALSPTCPPFAVGRISSPYTLGIPEGCP
jgi:hypothetical protein